MDLEDLDIEKNKLSKIEPNSFQHLNKLKFLNLKTNQIEQLDSNGFRRFGYREK